MTNQENLSNKDEKTDFSEVIPMNPMVEKLLQVYASEVLKNKVQTFDKYTSMKLTQSNSKKLSAITKNNSIITQNFIVNVLVENMEKILS